MKKSFISLNTGGMMPAIGFGTWKLANGKEAKEATLEAIKAGYRLVDTAKIYGNESSVGAAVRESNIPREELFVTTKLWTGEQGYDSALEAFKGSHGRLGLDYLDLYLIHWPGHDEQKRAESWRALAELYDQGRAKAVGVSNYTVEHLKELLEVSELAPAVNQIEFHPFIYNEQRPVLEFCREQAIAVEAYSPLAQARNLENKVIAAIAGSHGKSAAQVMLRWAVQHGTIPIPRSSNPQRIKSNFEIFNFELTDGDMAALDNLG